MAMQTVYVAVGSNIEPESNVRRALELLDKSLPLRSVSSFYWTPAIDRPEQPDYLNGVIRMQTEHPPGRLRDLLREVEHALDRVRTEDPFAPRTIDLDILLFGDAIISDGDMAIPDPDILTRPFLIAGLLELDSDLRLPGATEKLSLQSDTNAAALTHAPAITRELKEKYP